MFSDKILTTFRRSFDRREADHTKWILDGWLTGRPNTSYFSPLRCTQLKIHQAPPASRTAYGSSQDLLAATEDLERRDLAIIALLEFCRCYPEHVQDLIGCEAELAWRLWNAETTTESAR